ncbi:signal peptidase II [Thermaerobacter composti]|uniref:Lipoprotein signal peptidase n=1 Tax=Thermaerobacter composti TaxID=554949 RepID=A0ABZ0QTQ1_9FIRM|nr:signal peptidase II [Thermaerobacter composti]WPD19893.1 signal peptidase II [Thermaerobacter composti]
MRSVVTALLVLAADQAAKAWALAHVAPHGSVPALPGLVRWTYVENRGAAFGLFQNQTTFFVVVAAIVIAVILYWLPRVPGRAGGVRLALGLQLGGAVGNLVDRLRWGYVVDFVDLEFWPLHRWPVFNVADAAIVTGTALLVLWLLRGAEPVAAQRPTQPPGGRGPR